MTNEKYGKRHPEIKNGLERGDLQKHNHVRDKSEEGQIGKTNMKRQAPDRNTEQKQICHFRIIGSFGKCLKKCFRCFLDLLAD